MCMQMLALPSSNGRHFESIQAQLGGPPPAYTVTNVLQFFIIYCTVNNVQTFKASNNYFVIAKLKERFQNFFGQHSEIFFLYSAIQQNLSRNQIYPFIWNTGTV